MTCLSEAGRRGRSNQPFDRHPHIENAASDVNSPARHRHRQPEKSSPLDQQPLGAGPLCVLLRSGACSGRAERRVSSRLLLNPSGVDRHVRGGKAYAQEHVRVADPNVTLPDAHSLGKDVESSHRGNLARECACHRRRDDSDESGASVNPCQAPPIQGATKDGARRQLPEFPDRIEGVRSVGQLIMATPVASILTTNPLHDRCERTASGSRSSGAFSRPSTQALYPLMALAASHYSSKPPCPSPDLRSRSCAAAPAASCIPD